MEGRSSLTTRDNQPHNGIKIIEYVASSDPQHRKPTPFQIGLAQGVDARQALEFMSPAVNFNQDARRQTGEVGNIATDRVLTPKFEALWPHSKRPPQHNLRQRHLPP